MLKFHEALTRDFIRQTIEERKDMPRNLSMHVSVGGAGESITTTVLKITPKWDALLMVGEQERKSKSFADKHIEDLLAVFPMFSGMLIVEVLQYIGGLKRDGLEMGRKDDMFYFHDGEHCVAFWYTDNSKTGDFFAALEKTSH